MSGLQILLIAIGALVVGVPLFALFLRVLQHASEETLKRTSLYQDALALALADERVEAALGSPVSAAAPEGVLSFDGLAGRSSVDVILSGPKGSARLVARNVRLVLWSQRVREVRGLPGGGTIDLLKPPAG